jgi:hypothetical protein
MKHGGEAAARVVSEVGQLVRPGDVNPAAGACDSQPGLVDSDDKGVADVGLEPLFTPDQFS